MIVFSAIVPHSPLLAPSIGKEQRERLAATLKAYENLEQQLYLSKPESICIISPHAAMYPDAFSGNIAEQFIGQLKEFGDHGTKIEAKVDFLILDHIHRHMRNEQIPFTLSSNPEIDYGFTIPLLLLKQHLPEAKIIPLSISRLDLNQHIEFGRQLKRVIHAESKRIALIASADLAQHKESPIPSAAFDEGVKKLLETKNLKSINMLDQSIIQQCGLKPIATFLGCMEEINTKTKILCYEKPFEVGYLTAQLEIA